MNWMLPLETLPGWPEAPEVSTADQLLLMIVAPLALAVIVGVIAFTPKFSRRFRGEDPEAGTDVARREPTHAPEHSA